MKNIEKSECNARFGCFVREGRLRQGITQEEAATLLGYTQQYFSKIEMGKKDVGITEALNICNMLHLDLQDFIRPYL